MSLKIYLDDCAFSYRLRQLLIEAGHAVQIPAEVDPPLTGASDEIHFAHACATRQVILTYNPADFETLHKQRTHPGILAVYQDNNLSKDMTYRDMVNAIQNLEALGVDLAGGFWSLNQFQW